MPSGLVKTPEQEMLWEAAKKAARRKKTPPKEFYAYVNTIYQQMKGK